MASSEEMEWGKVFFFLFVIPPSFANSQSTSFADWLCISAEQPAVWRMEEAKEERISGCILQYLSVGHSARETIFIVI